MRSLREKLETISDMRRAKRRKLSFVSAPGASDHFSPCSIFYVFLPQLPLGFLLSGR